MRGAQRLAAALAALFLLLGPPAGAVDSGQVVDAQSEALELDGLA